MPPLVYRLSEERLLSTLTDLIRTEPCARIVEKEPGYLHVEFRSSWLRFVDDVEFFLDTRARRLHFRSASRNGYWDLGVNRKRMRRICDELTKLAEIDVANDERAS